MILVDNYPVVYTFNTRCCYYNSGLFDLHKYKYFQYKFYYEKIVSNVHQYKHIDLHKFDSTTKKIQQQQKRTHVYCDDHTYNYK